MDCQRIGINSIGTLRVYSEKIESNKQPCGIRGPSRSGDSHDRRNSKRRRKKETCIQETSMALRICQTSWIERNPVFALSLLEIAHHNHIAKLVANFRRKELREVSQSSLLRCVPDIEVPSLFRFKLLPFAPRGDLIFCVWPLGSRSAGTLIVFLALASFGDWRFLSELHIRKQVNWQ